MHGGWCVYVFFSPAFSLKVNLPFLFGFYLNIFPFDTVPRTFFLCLDDVAFILGIKFSAVAAPVTAVYVFFYSIAYILCMKFYAT